MTILDYLGNAAPQSEGGIILDFHRVKSEFREYLDITYDHKLALDEKDPLITVARFDSFDNDANPQELYPGVTLTDGPASVENMSKWIGEWARETFGLDYHYTVLVYEAATNAAEWSG